MASILRLPMSDAAPAPARALPRTVQLKDGTPVVLRLMTPADAAPIAAFARSLPEDDLLFLRMDITDPDAVAHWMRNLEAGLTTTVLAEAGGEIAGYAALVQNRVAWQRHLGEIRTQVALRFRAQGLGLLQRIALMEMGSDHGHRPSLVVRTDSLAGV